MTLEFHPLANLFPLIEGRDFDELVADVKANGLRERIVMFEGKILDGRNRYRAAVEADLFVEDIYWEGSVHFVRFQHVTLGQFSEQTIKAGPLAYVLSLNLHRRHLSESQRAMIASSLATMKVGRPSEWGNPASLPDSSHVEPPTQAEAGEILGVSERSVRTAREVQDHGAPELVDAVKRGAVKVSAAAEVAKLPVSEQLEILRSVPPRLVAQVARERTRENMTGSRSTMASRSEPPDSLDYFPTPPWATRALIEDVLPRLGRVSVLDPKTHVVWEPACGEGHIAGVLEEYGIEVVASDIHDYSIDKVSPPGWNGVQDFLGDAVHDRNIDWIITNPPFSDGQVDRSLEFALRALAHAHVGVALFVRQQWLEGVDRYERLFGPTPPTLVAQFAERVNLCKGRWDPEGSTATAYVWLVWCRAAPIRQPMFWVPPGRRVARARADDVERFTAHPVKSFRNSSKDESGGAGASSSGGQSLLPAGVAAPPVALADGPEGEGGESAALPEPRFRLSAPTSRSWLSADGKTTTRNPANAWTGDADALRVLRKRADLKAFRVSRLEGASA